MLIYMLSVTGLTWAFVLINILAGNSIFGKTTSLELKGSFLSALSTAYTVTMLLALAVALYMFG